MEEFLGSFASQNQAYVEGIPDKAIALKSLRLYFSCLKDLIPYSAIQECYGYYLEEHPIENISTKAEWRKWVRDLNDVFTVEDEEKAIPALERKSGRTIVPNSVTDPVIVERRPIRVVERALAQPPVYDVQTKIGISGTPAAFVTPQTAAQQRALQALARSAKSYKRPCSC